MSRIGKAPVIFDNTVQVSVSPANEVVVKGLRSLLRKLACNQLSLAKVEGDKVVLTRMDDTKETSHLHGLYRALIQNAVTERNRIH